MNARRRVTSVFRSVPVLLVLPLVLGARDCEKEADDGGTTGKSGAGGGAAGRAGSGGGGPAGGGDAAGRGGSGGDGGCRYAGERYDEGDSFPSDDGCNTCSCTTGGRVACTLRACVAGSGGGAAGRAGSGDAGNSGSGDAGSSGDGGSGGDDGGGSGTGAGSGQTCGGIASLECADPDEFCNYEESAGGQGCDGTISDAGGACRTRPQVCTEQFDPVCGCDRRTYSNDCAAHSAGASVLHDGQCTEVDCAEIGGHAVDGIGPAPECPSGEVEHGSIAYSNGMIAIEGTICCVPQ